MPLSLYVVSAAASVSDVTNFDAGPRFGVDATAGNLALSNAVQAL